MNDSNICFNLTDTIHTQECPLCKSLTTRDRIHKGMDDITVFGMKMEDIANALEYATYHGWKKKEVK